MSAPEPTATPAPRAKRRTLVLLLAFVAVLSAVPRWVMDERLDHASGGWTTNDPDSNYHMRRVHRAIEEGLPVAGTDPYLSFPGGAAIPWPPGYTYLLYAALAPFAPEDGEARRAWIERGTASLPFAFGVVTSVLVAAAAYVLAGRGAALIAGSYHALALGSILYSRMGNGDHHAVISLGVGLLLLMFAVVLERDTLARPRASVAWGAAAGAIAGFMLSVWVAALLYVIALDLVLAWALFLHAARPRPGLAWFGLAFHVAALAVLLPFCATSPWREANPFQAVNLSWFHPAFFTLGALVFVPLFFVRSGPVARRYPWIVGAVLAVVGGAMFLLDLGPASAIREGFEWVSRQDAFMADVRESRPLVGADAEMREHFAILGYLSPLVPIAWLAALVTALRGRLGLVPFVVAVPLLAPQAAQQMRFADALLPAMAVLLGWGGARLAARVPALARIPAIAMAPLIVLVVGAAHVHGLRPDPDTAGSEDRAAYHTALRGVFDWMRRETPATGDYAVLANWEFGHEIEWAADRPTVATNFGSYVGYEEYRDPARFFLATDAAVAEGVLDRRRVRYVVTTATQVWITRYLQNAIESPVEYVWTDDEGKHGMDVPGWCRTIGARLILGGLLPPASPLETQLGARIPPVGFLRLVHASPAAVPGAPYLPMLTDHIPAALVFERVDGARIEASAPRGTRLLVEVEVAFDALPRPLLFRAEAVAGAAGLAIVRVPYATDAAAGDGRATGPARWRLGEQTGTLTIPDADVRAGDTLAIP